MDETRATNWDIRLKTLALVGAAVSGVWAIASYRTSTEKEFRHPLWDRQLELYFKATDDAGKISTLSDSPEKTASIEDYWKLYFGPLAVVEDDELVCSSMVDFGDCLVKPGASFPKDVCDDQEIRRRALALANSCRRSIGADWSKKLDDLNNTNEKRACRLGRTP